MPIKHTERALYLIASHRQPSVVSVDRADVTTRYVTSTWHMDSWLGNPPSESRVTCGAVVRPASSEARSTTNLPRRFKTSIFLSTHRCPTSRSTKLFLNILFLPQRKQRVSMTTQSVTFKEVNAVCSDNSPRVYSVCKMQLLMLKQG
jgi:hypothetical protein